MLKLLKRMLLLVIFVPILAYSHPHSFITLKTDFYTEQDKLTKLHFIWTMDELTTSYLKLEYQNKPQAVLHDMMSNIIENHFFSEFWLKSSPQNQAIILMPQENEATLNIINNKAELDFWLTLDHPLPLSGNQFELMSYEKTFYVDMYYDKDSDVTINHSACNITIDKPTPDDATFNYAQALDKDEAPIETDDFVLGKLFAQKVVIKCQ